MMASSQVEIATSSPFSCNRRPDSCFQNNLCITNDNSHQIDLTDLWVHHPQWQTPTTSDAANYDDRPSIDYNPATTKCDDRPSIDYSPSTTKCDDRHSIDYSPAPRYKDKWARAREIVFPPRSEGSVDVSNSGGVSSLVQKWRGFEAATKSAGKTNTTTIVENVGGSPPAAIDDDSIGDWESDRTVCSGRSSCRGRDSDFTESERLRVADIIKKLTEDRCSEIGCDSPPRIRTSWDHQSTCPSPVVSGLGSPRIRGRQAYIDLLKQMERDRCKELERLVGRKAVTEFSHRGRIQALLRIKFLRRGIEAKDGRLSSESHKAKQSTPTHFRERANQSAQNGCGSCHKELTDKAPNLHVSTKVGTEDKHQEVANSKSSTSIGEEHTQDSTTCVEHDTSIEVNIDVLQNDIELRGHEHEATPFSTSIGQETNKESCNNHSSQESTETTTIVHNFENNEHNKKADEANNHQVTDINSDMAGDSQNYHEQESTSGQREEESDAYWVSNVSHPEAGWEEMQSDYEQSEVSKSDWIDEVSRPRSNWEILRQARYQEMLDPFLDNEEIRALLGRKSVSNFLSSGMREKIDNLMMCRSQGHQIETNNRTPREEKNEELREQGEAITASEGGEGQGHDGENEQDEGREGYGTYFDEFERVEERSTGQQCNECDECMTSPPQALWPLTKGNESSVYQSPSNEPGSSYRAPPAVEMELIYDLRRHMEQLHLEMSELRKSIKCCTDMQIKLQRSIKKEVATAITHADTKIGRRNSIKIRCCVCCKVQVDCVLYRCGHMCTCFQCAHELQWSSGKCPICRAPIMDVVRTYSNYST